MIFRLMDRTRSLNVKDKNETLRNYQSFTFDSDSNY